MSSAAATYRPGPYVMVPEDVDFNRTESRVWKLLMRRTARAEGECYDTSRKMSEEVGCTIRTIQAILKRFTEFPAGDLFLPLIERFRRYGPKDESGRVIRIIAPQVVPVERPDQPEPPRARPRRAGRQPADPPAGQVPNVGEIKGATAEQAAAAEAKLKQAAAEAADTSGVFDPDTLDPEAKELIAQARRNAAAARSRLPRMAAAVPPRKGHRPDRGPVPAFGQGAAPNQGPSDAERVAQAEAQLEQLRNRREQGQAPPDEQGGPPPQPAAP